MPIADLQHELVITPDSAEVRSIAMSVSVCLSVCPLAHLKKLRGRTSWNFLYMSAGTVARFSSDDDGICHVLPVLWMTSCFPYNTWRWQHRRRWRK